MLRSIFYALLACAFFGSTALAQAGETSTLKGAYSTLEQSQAGDATFTLAQWGGGYRVCCKRGWRDWWTSRRGCHRSGGSIVSGRFCRDDFRYRDDYRYRERSGFGRVCCKRGWRDWWTYSYRQCRRSGGYVVSNRQCRFD